MLRIASIVVIFSLSPPAQAQDRGAIAYTGTGFFVTTSGYLLTNLHVVKGCQTASLKVADVLVSARVLASDAQGDLALLKVEHSSAVLEFREEQRLRLGESIIVAGYPLAGLVASSMTLTTGTVSALAGLGDDTRMLQFTAPVQPGNSGGPLLDQSGHVVGIVTSKLSDRLSFIPQNVNFAIKGSVVREFLDSNGVDYRTAPSAADLLTTSIAEEVRGAVVSVQCEPGASAPNVPEAPANPSPIQRISELKTLAVGSLGGSEAAVLVREKLINRIANAGRPAIVGETGQADAVLTGAVATDSYGRAVTAALRLTTREGRILWAGESSAGRALLKAPGSASSHIAAELANEILKAIERDRAK